MLFLYRTLSQLYLRCYYYIQSKMTKLSGKMFFSSLVFQIIDKVYMAQDKSDRQVMTGLIIIFLIMGIVLFYIAFSTGGLGES